MSLRVPTPPVHLRPHAEVAERVLLPGDPGRALRLAQHLLETPPRMLNHHRGLWGYTGVAADGLPLTVQSTGLGGPSAAIVVHELVALGARRLIRVGTATALDGMPPGALVVAAEAERDDGASRALAGPGRALADAALTDALAAAAPGALTGPVVSTDLFYAPNGERAARWTRAGALAVELSAATVLTLAHRHGLAAACLLAIADGAGPGRLEGDALEDAERRMGEAAAAALGV